MKMIYLMCMGFLCCLVKAQGDGLKRVVATLAGEYTGNDYIDRFKVVYADISKELFGVFRHYDIITLIVDEFHNGTRYKVSIYLAFHNNFQYQFYLYHFNAAWLAEHGGLVNQENLNGLQATDITESRGCTWYLGNSTENQSPTSYVGMFRWCTSGGVLMAQTGITLTCNSIQLVDQRRNYFVNYTKTARAFTPPNKRPRRAPCRRRT